MSINASLVKELREKTGCPMMDCKKALVDTDGDVEAAQELLRKRGHESASKRKDRATAEGTVAGRIGAGGTRGAVVELLCETDFVAKNAEFEALAGTLADGLNALSDLPADEAAFLAAPVGDSTAQQAIQDVQATLKENIRLGRFARLDGGADDLVEAYTHFNGKIGVLIHLGLSSPDLKDKPPVTDLLKDLCMQVAFSAPLALNRDGVPAELVDRERAVLADLDEVKSKPEKVRPKIVEGKLGKFFKENTLLEQEFVKEKKTPVKKVLQRVGKEAGGTLEIRAFERIEVGRS
jgi:elongation factor Ts